MKNVHIPYKTFLDVLTRFFAVDIDVDGKKN